MKNPLSKQDTNNSTPEPDPPVLTSVAGNGDKALIEQTFRSLRKDYANKLPSKIHIIKDLWNKLLYSRWDDETLQLLKRLAHGLAGSGATFGFENLSQQAKALDQQLFGLIGHSTVTAREKDQVTVLIDGIEAASKEKQSEQENLPIIEPTQGSELKDKLIYVIDDDKHVSHFLSAYLEGLGYHTRNFSTLDLACKYIPSAKPDLILLDMMFPGGESAEFVSTLRRHCREDTPVIFISSRSDLSARATAMREGGDAYFTKPISVEILADKIAELLCIQAQHQDRVLLVEDDEALSHYILEILQRAGYQCKNIHNPIALIQSIDQFKPDVLIMDMYLPNHTGLELISILRQDPQLIGLPVVFISADDKEQLREQAFNAGVFEFLSKPINPDSLVKVIQKLRNYSRSVRTKIKALTKTSSPQRLVNRQYFITELETYVSQARWTQVTHVLMEINIEDYSSIIKKVGLEWSEALSQQLCAIFQKMVDHKALITQIRDNAYLILLQNNNALHCVTLTKALRENIEKHKFNLGENIVSLHTNAGLLELDHSINSVHEALNKVEQSLAQTQTIEPQYQQITPPTRKQAPEPKDNNEVSEIRENISKKMFELAYQPIVSLENSASELYEALIRMRMNDGSIVLPGQFLHIAAIDNKLTYIDHWVIEHAIRALSSDAHARSNSDLFVKLDCATICAPNIIAKISNHIMSGRIIGTNRVIFQVNEPDLLGNHEAAKNFAESVIKLGCGFAIDHFGETQSSLKLIETLPVTYIKLRGPTISMLLKHQLLENYLTHVFNKDIIAIASSIEDPAMLSRLWDLGIRFFQGYFIKEPDSKLKYDFHNPFHDLNQL